MPDTKARRMAKLKTPKRGEDKKGPAPARHIPWPEMFKHHISVCEGHTRMLEMIQKYTVDGTDNYATITEMVARGHEMLTQAKKQSRSFIPPQDHFDRVPIGSSTASSYPGYRPGDLNNGTAFADAGHRSGKMSGQVNGQVHGAKRKLSHPNDGEEKKELQPRVDEDTPMSGTDDAPMFTIDLELTPVEVKEPKVKKSKKEGPADVPSPIETEDITAEVEARLKAKEEKRMKKEEKKRRRSSGISSAEECDADKKKKVKKEKSNKREANDEAAAASDDGEGKKKKKRSA